MSSRTDPVGTADLIADALALARPYGTAPPLDRALQHLQDCQHVADALAQHLPEFDRARFLARVGWPCRFVIADACDMETR